jgi:N-acetylglucosamine-6-phosphate deacetylase
VIVRGRRIEYAGRRKRLPAGCERVDAQGGYISPGFVDLHVHGGGGADFMDGTVEAVRTACMAHARHGTTTLFPTTTTGTAERIHDMIRACGEFRKLREPGPTVAGVHLYGPYFAAGKAGCHPTDGCRAPVPSEFLRYLDSRIVRIVTCAAELPGAVEFARAARRKRCLITCGHSNSTWSEMQAMFDAGMRHVDHFWCAMSSVPSIRQRCGTPMQGSMAEFVLATRDMSTEVIADGCHLGPELLEFAWRMKGADRLCLVTDCNRALDCPRGEYRFGHQVEGTVFHHDGEVGRAANGNLASAVVGMDHTVRHMARVTSAPLHEIIRMASLTPAERTGISRRTGSLEPGKQADLVVLGQNVSVRGVWIDGVKMFD